MKKKHYFGRGAMFVLCAIFAIAFLLPTVLFFFVASDSSQYRISIAQVEKVIEDHSQDCAVDENLAHIIAIEGPGGIYDPQAA